MAGEQLSLSGSSGLGQTGTQSDVSQGKGPACSLRDHKIAFPTSHRNPSQMYFFSFLKETTKQIYSFLCLSLKQVDSDS